MGALREQPEWSLFSEQPLSVIPALVPYSPNHRILNYSMLKHENVLFGYRVLTAYFPIRLRNCQSTTVPGPLPFRLPKERWFPLSPDREPRRSPLHGSA